MQNLQNVAFRILQGSGNYIKATKAITNNWKISTGSMKSVRDTILINLWQKLHLFSKEISKKS